jgi:hypothetical protein
MDVSSWWFSRGDSKKCNRRAAGRLAPLMHGMRFQAPNGGARMASAREPGGALKKRKAKRRNAMAPRYGRKASEKVERAMHEMKRGQLRSGGSGRKVTSRKQAIAIGLSEARRAGGKVPKRAGASRSRTRSGSRSRSRRSGRSRSR